MNNFNDNIVDAILNGKETIDEIGNSTTIPSNLVEEYCNQLVDDNVLTKNIIKEKLIKKEKRKIVVKTIDVAHYKLKD